MLDEKKLEQEQEQEQSALERSDEEILKLGDSYLTPRDNDEEQDDEEEENNEDDSDDENEEESEPGSEDDDEPNEEDIDSEDPDTEKDPESGTDGKSKNEDDGEDGDDDPDESDSVSAENFFKQVTAPFKANGKMMEVKTADDVIRLMQMGANYNRKMGALKPQLAVLRMLEKNELLDEGKLNFLIDLSKGDPKAITKLVSDHKVNPMDIDTEKADEYESSDHSVNESEVELDEVIQDLQDSETFGKTLNLVTKEWDEKSKQIVADQPELLRVIDGHMASGVYDLISTEVEKERMFGRLAGKTDIEAYQEIGDSMNERGAFDHLFEKNEQEQGNKPPKPSSKSPKDDKSDKEARKKARRANSSTKRAAKGGGKEDFNPLSLSDEEILKQYDPRLM